MAAKHSSVHFRPLDPLLELLSQANTANVNPAMIPQTARMDRSVAHPVVMFASKDRKHLRRRVDS